MVNFGKKMADFVEETVEHGMVTVGYDLKFV